MRNPTYEQALAKQGLGFEYAEQVPLDNIDASKGLRNQARLECPLDEGLVDRYAACMRDGDQFPPLVLWRPGRGAWIPVDGNQRLAAAAKAKRKTFDAYLLETKDQMVADRISWVFNNLVNGKRLSLEESLQHAVSFVRKYGMDCKQAAKEWGVPDWKVRNEVRLLELKDALGRQNVRRLPPDEKLVRIASVEKAGEDVLALAAAAVAENGLTPKQCDEMAAQVSRAKTHEAKLQAVAEYAVSEEAKAQKEITKGGRSAPKVLPRDRLAQLVSQCVNVVEQFPAGTLRPQPKAKYDACRQKAMDLVVSLTAIYGLGALPQEEAV